MTEARQDEISINIPAKHGKIRKGGKPMSDIKVEETSLNWSRLNR